MGVGRHYELQSPFLCGEPVPVQGTHRHGGSGMVRRLRPRL
nr:MAG TPA: hypothetical protein [Caudoviricetes sp.]